MATHNVPHFQLRCETTKVGTARIEVVGVHLCSILMSVVERQPHMSWGFKKNRSIKVAAWQGLQGFGRAQEQHPSSQLAGRGRSSRMATNRGCGRTPPTSLCLDNKHKLWTRDTELPRALELPRLCTTPTWSLSTMCWSSNHLHRVQ